MEGASLGEKSVLTKKFLHEDLLNINTFDSSYYYSEFLHIWINGTKMMILCTCHVTLSVKIEKTSGSSLPLALALSLSLFFVTAKEKGETFLLFLSVEFLCFFFFSDSPCNWKVSKSETKDKDYCIFSLLDPNAPFKGWWRRSRGSASETDKRATNFSKGCFWVSRWKAVLLWKHPSVQFLFNNVGNFLPPGLSGGTAAFCVQPCAQPLLKMTLTNTTWSK